MSTSQVATLNKQVGIDTVITFWNTLQRTFITTQNRLINVTFQRHRHTEQEFRQKIIVAALSKISTAARMVIEVTTIISVLTISTQLSSFFIGQRIF